jgi:hypothetical protein
MKTQKNPKYLCSYYPLMTSLYINAGVCELHICPPSAGAAVTAYTVKMWAPNLNRGKVAVYNTVDMAE